MKKIIIPILFIIILYGFMMPNNVKKFVPSKGEQLIDSILANCAKSIREKYNIRSCGVGVAMPEGPIRGITMCFNTSRALSKEQLREMLIKIAQELYNQININSEIQQYLYEHPFTINKLEIEIYNRESNGSEVYDPGISTAALYGTDLFYFTVDSKNKFTYKHEFVETYEEALKAIQ